MSLAIFQSSRGNELEKALLMLSTALLNAMCREAIRGDASDSFHFQETMRQLCNQVGDLKLPTEAQAIAGKADQAMAEYYKQTTTYFAKSREELQGLIRILFTTVSEIDESNAETATQFKAFEKQLIDASDATSLHDCRLQISKCLFSIREEAKRHRQQNGKAMSQLKSNVDVQNSVLLRPVQSGDDPVSGLAARSVAEEAIKAHNDAHTPNVYLAVFVIHRINALNGKYGYGVGDSILRRYLQYLMQSFADVDELYRWSGPTFLAIVRRPQGIGLLRDEVIRLVGHRIEESTLIANRDVLIPISASGLVLEIGGGHKLEESIAMVEKFVKANL